MIRSVSAVTTLGVLTQFAGFLRIVLIAAGLGVSQDVDAYNLGLILPTFITTVAASWLQVGFLGRYVGLLSAGQKDLASEFRLGMLMLLLAIGTVVGCTLAAYPAEAIGPFLSAGQIELTAYAVTYTAWLIPPVLLAEFMGLTLNGHGRFGVPALAPMLNAVVSVVALWLWPTMGIEALGVTLVLGAVVQLLTVLPAFVRLGVELPRGSGVSREMIGAVVIGLPLVPAFAITNLGNAVIQLYCARLGEGAVAIMGYATRIHGAITQVLIIGMSTVLLPHLAMLWAEGDKERILRLFRALARVVAVVASLMGIGVYLLGDTAIEVLLARGSFGAEGVQHVSSIWFLLTLSLFPQAFGTFVAKLFQATRRSLVILASSVVSLAAIWLVAAAGAEQGSLGVIALATTVSTTAGMIFWMWRLSKYMSVKQVIIDIRDAVPRMLLVLGPILLVDSCVATYTDVLPGVLEVAVRGLIMLAVAGITMIVLRMPSWLSRPVERAGIGAGDPHER